jgi:hypothetical protein
MGPFRHGLHPLVLPSQRDAHSCVRRVTLYAPDPFPKPLKPRHGRPPRLQQALASRPSGTTALMTGPRLLDLGRPSEI